MAKVELEHVFKAEGQRRTSSFNSDLHLGFLSVQQQMSQLTEDYESSKQELETVKFEKLEL